MLRLRQASQGKGSFGTWPPQGAGRKQDRPARVLLLYRQLPVFDAYQVSTIVVDAGTEQTYIAVRALDPG